ncbi:MAG: tRNA (adenosine(37)-N6)-threonylcarbamoyltransferase complex dimerization subunit type 1 TsaB [Gemmatimonas sp.]|nr:tRNA (adenosine(37)-N6)-threonylcarbamoyltransferase complex dimerization subunit type 1 TsaB [Gemmatimonas sp.]
MAGPRRRADSAERDGHHARPCRGRRDAAAGDVVSAPRSGGNALAPGLTLALDASTYVGTVAVLRDGVVVAAREALMRGEHEERLMPAVLAALADVGAVPRDVARVVCGAGPGSFTSLRIAAGIAKGVAHGANVPLYAVSSLALVVAGAGPALSPGRYIAALDAMRGERYAQTVMVYDDGRVEANGPSALATAEQLAAERCRVVGPLEGDAHAPHARGVAALLDACIADGPVDLDAWEPSYGRLAEAQVRWEAAHGRSLASG